MFIYQTMISRTSDGLPLSASTDRISPSSQSKINLQEGFQQLKLVCKRATHFADRCSYIVGPLAIYFISALNITYSVLCDVSYPSVLAFSFLNDVQREFLLDYDKSKVDAALRPYSLIAFGKCKHIVVLLIVIVVTLIAVVIFSIFLLLNPSGIGGRYIPLGVSGCSALFMSALCSALHLLHGFNVLGTGVVDVYDEDFTQYAAAFFISFVLTGFQIYLMLVPVKKKTALAGATLASICLCQLYVWEYKNSIVAILFYVAVASFTTFIICTRRLEEKQKQYML
ncbi:vesicle-trafficking protein SEC22a [Octopus bimaculoides]|nr:vesicle-trafficking protein SEC22a [Octopus bimaculoides]